MFLTYVHYTPNGTPFYIGKGSSERRAFYTHKRNAHWKNTVNKYGNPKVEIVARWQTEKEALDHEVFLISCFRGLGYRLTNLTDGGEGSSGFVCPEERKIALSKRYKGIPGKCHSEETKKKLSLSHKGQPAWNKGLVGVSKQSTETIEKRMSKIRGQSRKCRFTYIGSDQNGNVVFTLSGNIQMEKLGFDPSRIRSCANGKRKSYKGYKWAKAPWKE